ncbi:MAG: hypothetical protein ACRBN8_09615 [Nannocystales bacterium]
MNERSLYGMSIDAAGMRADIEGYDARICRGRRFSNDDQLRRIANSRDSRGDRLRACKFQRILDLRARPLIAIRGFILARKSLGWNPDGPRVPGLEARRR